MYNYEIEKLNVMGNDTHVVAHTTDTILLGSLESKKISEIPWQGSGNEKFFFNNPFCCTIFNAGELTLVEYGVNDILGTVRTEHVNSHLLSLRVNDRQLEGEAGRRRIAYLVDLKTVSVVDFSDGATIATIAHDARIDWLELNETARLLLFRDRRRRLHLYNLETEERTSLLSVCSYVQWVPGSDVVVAQSRNNLCIWYSIDHAERVTTFPIKGDVEDIEHVDGRTEVVVDEGVSQVSYELDEGLIEFGTAIEDRNLQRAAAYLEKLELTPETEAMWRTLGKMALESEELVIAERSYVTDKCPASCRLLAVK